MEIKFLLFKLEIRHINPRRFGIFCGCLCLDKIQIQLLVGQPPTVVLTRLAHFKIHGTIFGIQTNMPFSSPQVTVLLNSSMLYGHSVLS